MVSPFLNIFKKLFINCTKKIKAAASIREASTTAGLTKKYSIASSKVNSPKFPRNSIAARKPSEEDDSKSDDARQDRNRQSLMYDEEDDTKANPKLEMEIIKDRERIDKERDERKKTPSSKHSSSRDSPRPSTSREISTPKQNTQRDSSKKLETSAKKFKEFIDLDVKEKSTEKEEKSDKSQNSNSTAGTAGTSKNSSTPPRLAKETESNGHNSSFSNSKKRLSSPIKNADHVKRVKMSPAKNVIYKPFGKLLEGVVLVISGIQVSYLNLRYFKRQFSNIDCIIFFQNPDRADIRDKAIRMGARYKPDWDSTCTHLM